jgi:hypothetical protein
MKSLWTKIKKLLTALNMNGYMLMVNREMVYSEKIDRMCTVIKLNQLIPIDEYYKLHPEKKRRKTDNRKYIKETIESSFKEIDILKELIKCWNKFKGGDG